MKTKPTTKPAGKARKSMSKRGARRAARTPATRRTTRTRDPRLPTPGTTITRTFKGRELRVEVLDAGFRWDGKEFRSLTAVALAITGYPAISGPHFFGLDAAATTATTASSRTTKPRASKQATKNAAPMAIPTAPTTPAETATA